MNARERFLQTMHFGQPDRVPHWEMLGYWRDTLERWQDEGMPGDVHVRAYFEFDRWVKIPVNTDLAPAFKEETLDEDAETKVVRLRNGAIARVFKDWRKHSIPQYISMPIKTRADFAEYKKRLNPKSPCRYPQYFEDYAEKFKERDYPVSITAGSLFGLPRGWMSLEGLSYALYDDPALVEEMMEYNTEFIIETIRPALTVIPDIDFACFWEDMAYNHGSLISPKHFKELMSPRYRRITDFLRKHGIEIILVDCDGLTDELIPLWLDAGLTGVYPVEIAAGNDPVEMRKKYGRDLHMVGGIDKRALARDKKAIEKEVMAKVPPLLEAGGWIPGIDHAVPKDVPFENYCYFRELVKKLVEKG